MVDSAISPPVRVTAYDSLGNVVTAFSGVVTVALGNDASALHNARLSGATTAAASGGVATFSGLRLDQAGQGYTLKASATGSATVTSAAFDVTLLLANPDPPTHLGFTTQPGDAQAGGAVLTRVAFLDSAGIVVPGYSGAVTITLGANPAGGTLSGTRTVNATNGVATFSDLSLDKAGSGYTLAATAGTLPGATSSAFAITPGPAVALAFTVQPSKTPPLTVIQPPVQVTAYDAFGNLATTSGATIVVAIGHDGSVLGGAVLSGTKSRTLVNGIATFDDLSIDQVGSGYTLTAALGSAAPLTTSAPFDIAVL